MALSTAPAQGLGPNYHHLHGLSQPNLLHCTDAEAQKLAAVDDLLEALRMLMDIHEKPANLAGKYGKALDAAIHAQQVKVDAAAAAARAAIAKATGGCT